MTRRRNPIKQLSHVDPRNLPYLTRGQVLRIVMYLRGIGQEEAAQVAGCSRSLINLALADSDRVDDKTVEEIGWRLGVSGFRLNRFPKQKLGGSLDG